MRLRRNESRAPLEKTMTSPCCARIAPVEPRYSPSSRPPRNSSSVARNDSTTVATM